MCCEGPEIDWKDLRTPEQQAVMAGLAPLLWGGIERGATPFGGQLTASPDPSMLSAMNMMMGVGGQQPYRFPGMQTGAYPQPAQPTPIPWSALASDYGAQRRGEDKGAKAPIGHGMVPTKGGGGGGNWISPVPLSDPYAPAKTSALAGKGGFQPTGGIQPAGGIQPPVDPYVATLMTLVNAMPAAPTTAKKTTGGLSGGVQKA